MKILITGATGYIGFHVALALRRAGHEVWGLARSLEKARRLEQNEILPTLGSLQEPKSFLRVAEECAVLVHAAADYQADTLALDRETLQALLDAGSRGARPKTVVYTSGVWVYGNTGSQPADETAPLLPPHLVVARPGIERMVLDAGHVRGLVIRPGCVYGHQGSLTAMWFSGAHLKRSLQAIGDGSNRWAMIHVEDLADLYLRAIESGLRGELFNATDRSRSTVREMVQAVAEAAGYSGEIRFVPVAEAAKSMGPMAECLALDQHVDSRKAVRLLGWQPRHGGFVDDCVTYFLSWKTAQT